MALDPSRGLVLGLQWLDMWPLASVPLARCKVSRLAARYGDQLASGRAGSTIFLLPGNCLLENTH